jgi:hypothetical protein
VLGRLARSYHNRCFPTLDPILTLRPAGGYRFWRVTNLPAAASISVDRTDVRLFKERIFAGKAPRKEGAARRGFLSQLKAATLNGENQRTALRVGALPQSDLEINACLWDASALRRLCS